MVFELHEISKNNKRRIAGSLLFAVICLAQGACSSTAPSIAHVHIGHAITGANDTPSKGGYFVLAELRAEEALRLAQTATESNLPSSQIVDRLARVNEEVNLRDDFGLTTALREAASHIAFAAESDDASQNVKRSSRAFTEAVDGVITRANLINLYAQDAQISTSDEETRQLAGEILKLSEANLNGQDLDGDGFIGSQLPEYGVRQLRRDLDALIARENPPYATVDRWYLFNLIRMPSGDWLFRRRDGAGSGTY